LNKETLRAGVSRAEIDLPEELFPTEGFTNVHDKLHVRLLLLEYQTRFALVSLEITSIPGDQIEKMRKLVGETAGLTPENVWICATHTFSAPHFIPPGNGNNEKASRQNTLLYEALADALRVTASKASSSLQEVNFGYKTGYCNVNINRDIPSAEGWWLGTNETGPSDKTVTVLRFESLSGDPLALLFVYDIQSSVMDGSAMADGGRAVSADLAGAACRYVEEIYDEEVTAIFCIGAAADQAPAYKAKYFFTDLYGKLHEEDLHEQGYVLMNEQGRRLGRAVVETSEKICCWEFSVPFELETCAVLCPGQFLNFDIHSLEPAKEYQFIPDKDRKVNVEAIRLGETVLVGLGPELTSATSAKIKERSPFSMTIILTMMNGAAKYMADEDAYNRISYESMNSFFAKGSAEILESNVHELLNKMI
jgi:hypothetical protein